MKSNFKYIVIAIICSLSVVFLWQLFWLKGLYNSIKTEQETEVRKAIETANMDELQYRLDELDKSSKKENKARSITMSKSISSGNESEYHKIEAVSTKKIIEGNDTTITSLSEEEADDLSIRDMATFFNLINRAIHQAIDSVKPINFHILDSSILANLQEKKIVTNLYYTEIVNLSTNQIVNSSLKDSTFTKETQTFIYNYDSENHLAYRVHMEPLTKSVLAQMSGILGTTLLIILILGFAFWYLIKTVMRQKTLEEMKDDFTNNMTHELKTPIAVAYSATDALLNFKQGDNKETRDRYLTICKDQLEHLTGLVEQILSMSIERRQTFVLNKEDMHVKDLIDSIVEQHKLKAGKEVVFNIHLDDTDLIINADRTHLNNMISNLVDNAIKYSRDNKRVDINISVKDNYAVISIKDNGIGISAEKQHFVFDKFYRVPDGNKQNVKGYGLGLFYVKTMAEKHGGSVSVSSSRGDGSTFTLKIPVEK